MRPEIAELPKPEVIDIAALAKAYASGEVDLICVLGPTASGKTKYAVRLAHNLLVVSSSLNRREVTGAHQSAGRAGYFGEDKIRKGEKAAGGVGGCVIPRMEAEIISADSRQIYRGMDIGTGKDLKEYGDVPYHLIDIAPAGAKFNIYEYQAAFAKAWADICRRGAIPILCGGSGLWIESVTRAYKFENGNGVSADALPQKVFYIGTLVSREERVARIDKRLEERLQEGLVEEIRGLLDSGIPADDLIYYGLEYKFVTQYVLGQLSYDDMVIALGNAIHQFAKRQMTWFRGMERDGVRIHWVRP